MSGQVKKKIKRRDASGSVAESYLQKVSHCLR